MSLCRTSSAVTVCAGCRTDGVGVVGTGTAWSGYLESIANKIVLQPQQYCDTSDSATGFSHGTTDLAFPMAATGRLEYGALQRASKQLYNDL